jgi:hypothetical protein
MTSCSPLAIPPGFEKTAVESARRALDDIPECRGAELYVKWMPGNLPILVIHFAQFARRGASPAVAVALMTVQRGTLSDIMPGKTLLSGERLRDAILRSVHTYFRVNPPADFPKVHHAYL